MDAFEEMRKAVGDWLALVRPDAIEASVFISWDFQNVRHSAHIPCARSIAMPTDPTTTRGRLLAALRRFVGAAYPDADYWGVVRAQPGAPLAMLFVSPADGRCEESRQADDFGTTDEWPVNEDGSLGKRLTKREGMAKHMRRTARYYKRERARRAAASSEN